MEPRCGNTNIHPVCYVTSPQFWKIQEKNECFKKKRNEQTTRTNFAVIFSSYFLLLIDE